MKLKKTIIGVLVAVMLMSLLAGCQSESPKDVQQDDTKAVADQKDDTKQESEEVTDEGFMISKNVEYLNAVTLAEGSQADFNSLKYSKGDVPRIAYMPPATEFNYYMAIGEGIKSLAEEMGAESFMLAPQSGADISGQMGMLQDVISQQVDIIILSTHDEAAAAPLVKQAVEQGIQVIIVNSDIQAFPTPIHAVVGYNQRNGTRMMGEYVSAKLGDQETVVGIIEGQPGWHSTERVGGFLDGIEGKSNFSVAASLDGKWNVEGGNTAAMDMLQAHPEIQLLFAANDYEIMGASKAVSSLGRDDVLLFGNDGDTACLEEIAAGTVDATVNTTPFIMGRIALQVAMDGIAGEFDGGYVETPTVIVDKDNVIEYLSKPEALYPKPSKDY